MSDKQRLDTSEKQSLDTRIAIVGVSALFPGSIDKQGFWRDIYAGSDLLSEVPESHWLIEDYYDPDPKAPDKTYAKRGAFLHDVDFDALSWGVPPSIMSATDTSQLLALIVANRVLQDAAREQFDTMDRSRISVILGVTSAQELLASAVSRLQHPMWRKGMREAGIPEDEVEAAMERIAANYTPWQESTFPGLLGNVVAGRIANRLDLGGTNCVTDAACASTFSAIAMGVSELVLGDSDLVITGGVDTLNDIFMFMCFSKTPALSPTGDCRPFSAAGDGTMLGEGMGMVALKRLEDAERDGDQIYAVLNAVGTSSDGRSKSVYAPVSAGQSKALIRAYQKAGYGPETVELVEAHGTGTVAGDAAEFNGLRLAFDDASEDRQWCALGSVKSQIGHTKAAAGAAGIFKAMMALRHGVFPPTIKIDEPNPKLDIENSPFYLSRSRRPWVRGSDHARRASVSSFGFGGSNFHIALEQYTGPLQAGRLSTMPAELVVVCAADGAALATEARRMADTLPATPDGLRWVSVTSQQAYDASAGARLSLVVRTKDELAQRLRSCAERIEESATTPFELPDGTAFGVGAHDGDVAFLFPGQGSQHVAMGDELAMAFDACMGAWDTAADVAFDDSTSLQDVVFPVLGFDPDQAHNDSERLRATEWAQPAIGCASASQLALLRQLKLTPSAVAGHSYGELTALYAAGAMTLPEFLRASRVRGELMRDAAKTPGAMLALNVTIDEARSLIERFAEDVVVANHNHPTQVVLSGPERAVDAFIGKASADGYDAKKLPVATAFHSPVVSDSCAPFAEALKGIEMSEPTLTVYSGVEAKPHDPSVGSIKTALAQQIAAPIRFVEMVEAMHAAGVRTFIEVGPRSVLTGLTSKTLGDKPHTAISLERKGKLGTEALLLALGRLVAAGVSMDLGELFAEYQPATDPSTVVAARMPIPINGSNFGKPYPPEGGAAALPKPNPPRQVAAAPVHAAAASASQSTAPQTATATAPTALRSHSNSSSPPSQATVNPKHPQATAAPAQHAAPASSHSAASAPAGLDWLATFRETQRRTAEVQAMYQASMAQAHSAYLQMAQQSLQGLSAMQGVPQAAPVMQYAAPQLAAPAPTYTAPAPAPAYSAPAPAPVYAAPAPAPTLVGVAAPSSAPVFTASPAPAPAPAPAAAPVAAAPAPAPAPVAAAPAPAAAPSAGVDVNAVMLEVVAESTGYPPDMLTPEMALEGDLGIDSIKRVEILSTVQDQIPGLPAVDANHMGSLETLGQIVDYMQGLLGGPAPAPSTAATPSAAAPAPANGAPANGAPANGAAANVAGGSAGEGGADVQSVMLEVVAESTGYPADMLGMEMALEGDLGIDSIKRVEILSAVQDRVPGLPAVDAGHMGSLETLGQIVDYMQGLLGGASGAATEGRRPFDLGVALGRYTLATVPALGSGFAQQGLFDGPVYVTTDGTGLNASVCARLRRRGVDAHPVSVAPDNATAVVYLGGLRAVSSDADAIAVNKDAFEAARRLGASLEAPATSGLFVTLQDTGGRFGLSPIPAHRSYLAGLASLARTAHQEWPTATIKAVDLERAGRDSDAVADAIANELLAGGPELEVGLSATGERVTLASLNVPVTTAAPAIGPDDVIVVSGGARGVTAACMIAWAERTKAKFVMLGRTPLSDEPACCAGIEDDAGLKRALLGDARARGEKVTPAQLGKQASKIMAAREIRGTLGAITAAGGHARYEAVSVTDGPGVAAVLDRVRGTLGPVTGIVHAAGVLADKRIVDKTDADFAFVFDTKIDGLQALLEASSQDALKVFAVFSSVAARCGNNGQCDYAMANEVLAKVCADMAMKHPERVVKSFGWGPWEGGMVTPQLKARFESLGVAMIPLDVGARMFVDEMTMADRDTVDLVFGGEPRSEALIEDGASPTSTTVEIVVDKATHPYLADHAIAGTPVVPVVTVADWFARAARAVRPGLHLGSLDELRVLKGIRLEGYANGGDRFSLRCEPDANDENLLALELRSPGGSLHYRAKARMVADAPRSSAGAPEATGGAWTGDVYGDVLFHGDAFRVIEAMTGASDNGVSANIHGVKAKHWPDEPWALDVAALDGGLQLALLFTQHALGGASLPTSIESVRAYQSTPSIGPLQCVATKRRVKSAGATTDIAFMSESGERVLELCGVQTHLLPSTGA